MVDYIWQNISKLVSKEENLRTSLQSNELFKDLSARELSLVEKTVHHRRFRSGELIFRQGETGVGMYIIMSGTVSVFVEEADPELNELNRIQVAELGKQDFFGELALVEKGGRRTATAIAHDESQLIGFFQPDLATICERSPTAGVKILGRLSEILGHRLHETTKKVTELKKELRRISPTDNQKQDHEKHASESHSS